MKVEFPETADHETMPQDHTHRTSPAESSESLGPAPSIELSLPRLTWNRLDLAVMFRYLDSANTTPSAFSEQLYDACAKAISDGSPRVAARSEPPSDRARFDAICRDMRRGVSGAPLPRIALAADGSVLTGAADAACALFLDRPVDAVRTTQVPVHFDFRFFERQGLNRDQLDAAALRFVESARDCFVALIWPAAQGSDDELERILGPLVYRKEVSLNPGGAHNLLSQVYAGESWLGDPVRHYPGIQNKQVHCFRRSGPLRVLVFQKDGLEEVLAAKQAVRDVYGLGKHSIHVTDTHAEAIKVARLLLNDRSVHFLNAARPTRFAATLEMAEGFQAYLDRTGVPPDRIAIDSGMVLAAYGLRETQDVDFVSSVEVADEGIFSRHGPGAHDIPVGDLLYDPRNHFHYWGLKFVSLEQVARMKRRRKAGRDVDDLGLIGPVLAARSANPRLQNVVSHLRYVVAKGRRQVVQATRRLGLHASLKKAQQRLRRRGR